MLHYKKYCLFLLEHDGYVQCTHENVVFCFWGGGGGVQKNVLEHNSLRPRESLGLKNTSFDASAVT